MNPEKRKERIILKGDLPSPANPPSGCPFHTRCPLVREACKNRKPYPIQVGDKHTVSCILHEEVAYI